MSVFKVGDKVVILDLDSPEEIAAGHRIDHAVDVNEMGDDTHIENTVSPVGEVMRSEFDELKRFAISDILSVSGKQKTTETINKHFNAIIDIAFLRGQLSQQYKIDELQKENSALVHVIKSRDIQLENEKHEYDELMNKLVDSMMENKELQKRVDAALKILYTKKKMYVDMIIEIEQVIKYGSDESN